MTKAQRPVVVALVVLAWSVGAYARQQPAPVPAVAFTPAQMETFLLTARIDKVRPAGDGITNSQRATLSDGTVTHDAHVQVVDEARTRFETAKITELNFKDTYRYNIAAYRLAQLLDLDNVPMSVERSVQGKPAAVTWWVDEVMMDEGDRQKKKMTDPNPQRGGGYVFRQRVFDELIQNRDRNLGNLLYTNDWKMWMIDHTRAFRTGRQLLKPEQLTRIERSLLAKLRELNVESLTQEAGRSLTKEEIAGVMARRDVIVKLFDDRIAKTSEGAVLYTLPR